MGYMDFEKKTHRTLKFKVFSETSLTHCLIQRSSLYSLTNTKLIYIPYYSSETSFENSMCSRIIRNQISHTSATSAQRNSSKKSTSQITKWDFINWKKTTCVLNVVRCFWLLEHWKNTWKLNILTLKFMSVMFVRKSSKERTS